MAPFPYILVITGGVGVGKTTLIQELVNKEGDFVFIKEYVDYLPVLGERMLHDSSMDPTSLFDFQKMILSGYAMQLMMARGSSIIMERTPLESVKVFAALDVEARLAGKHSSLLDSEITTLERMAKNIMNTFEIPYPGDCPNTTLLRIPGRYAKCEQIQKLMFEDYDENRNVRWILLETIQLAQQMLNICERGREPIVDSNVKKFFRINVLHREMMRLKLKS